VTSVQAPSWTSAGLTWSIIAGNGTNGAECGNLNTTTLTVTEVTLTVDSISPESV
jgi:hypothetical protein